MNRKKLILIIAISFIGLSATAQGSQEGYFSVKENFIVWTKIYDAVPSLGAMKKNPLLEFTSEEGGIIKKCRPTSLNNKTLVEITGNFLISQKDGRYKVEVFLKDVTFPIYVTMDISNLEASKKAILFWEGIKFREQDSLLHERNIIKDDIDPFQQVATLKPDTRNNFDEVEDYSKPLDILFSSFFDPKKKN